LFEKLAPAEIEKRSFEIITSELEEKGIVLPKENELVIKRCIHTSADFDYAETLSFSEGAVEKMKEFIRGGAVIVTDTNMGLAGVNKKKLATFGGEAFCFMADEDVAAEAKDRGVTRAAVSMEKAAKLDRDVIFAIGNAPTALIRLHEMMEEGSYTPKFVIGVPVGFVNVVASKELFLDSDVPYIINRGRKGGSNIAAAICNAVLYNM
jgi:precorrin-8X/cobalt-precorrin-8 methylmutase